MNIMNTTNVEYILSPLDLIPPTSLLLTHIQFDDYDPVDKIILEKSHKIKDCSVEVKKATPRNADMGAGHMMGGGRGNTVHA